ncbi:LuxR C-terminal-related transcriptional regulator [Dactylosporangium sp. CA-092794]|uniref:LuxR C-terminal-related transcriptional regulator n=1 Tax=Dactylosporangium sp. CA-092794 TaxID=3239929 RepID=UPI003D8F8D17
MPRADAARRGRELRQRLRTGWSDGGDPLDVLHRTATELLRHVPADIWCAVLLDPSTLLDTGGQHAHGFPEAVMPRLFQIEHIDQDGVDALRRLVRQAAPARLLSLSTGGDPAACRYYREILRPLDLADELRVLIRDEQRVWGLLVLCRHRASAPFTADDLAVAGRGIGPAVTALRRSLLVTGAECDGAPDAPAVLTLGPDERVSAATDAAKSWLDLIPEAGRAGRDTLPYPVHAVVARARASAGGHAVARLRGRNGQWLAVHAMPMTHPGGTTTTVSIGPVEPGELCAIVLNAYGLTPREHDIAQLVLLGRSTAHIQQALHITEDTVQDHLKSVFRKTGVHSRRELVGVVFTRHYLPSLNRAPLTTDGRLIG